jgi:hypothetical protein
MKRGTTARVYHLFERHGRRYCFFSLFGNDDTFLYFSHTEKPLRSIVYGRGFLEKLPALLENEDLCIECGLGLAIAGGIALDGNEIVDHGCSAEEANRILLLLAEHLGDQGLWIEQF